MAKRTKKPPTKPKSRQKPETTEVASLDTALVRVASDATNESERTKHIRRSLNRRNWDVYHGRYRFKKKKGQSRKFLHKSAIAAEQISALFKSATMNFDKWIEVESVGGFQDEIFDANLVKNVLRFYMEKAKIKLVMSDAIKVATHESKVTLKIGGKQVPGPRFPTAKPGSDKNWELRIWLVPFEDYFEDPDPVEPNSKLFRAQRVEVDKFRIMDKAKSKGGIYDDEKLDKVTATAPIQERQHEKDRKRGNNQSQPAPARRKKWELLEYWGTVLDDNGDVMKGEDGEELRNVVYTVANRSQVIRGPIPNPRWAGVPPYITGRLLRVPFSEWDKALMDSAADLNITSSELFNLMVDGAMSSIFGIRQIKPHLLADPRQVEDGIPSQTTLITNEDIQPGDKALEVVASGQPPNEVLPFFNAVNSLLAENAFANETRLGALPAKRVLATEIASSNQALSQVFDSLSGDFEEEVVEPMAEQSWLEILQNVDKFPEEDLVRLLSAGGDESSRQAAAEQVAQLNALSKKQRFLRGAKGFKFTGKGIKSMQAAMQDFQRTTTLIQTMAGVPQLFEEFSKKHSFSRLLDKLMLGIGVDSEEIQKTPDEVEFTRQLAAIREKALADQEAQGGPQQANQPGAVAASSPQPNQNPGISSGNEGNQ